MSKNKSKETSITKESVTPEPSHVITGDYAALMETNGKECESWYYFIRKEGNEDALKHLQTQLEQVEWYILDDLSTFDLDLEHFVTAQTAKQMTKLELNAYAFHRKFDGKLKTINLGFKKKDNNERKMTKTFDILGYGLIEEYIDDEDLDPEDLTEVSTEEESSSEEESKSSSEEEEKTKRKTKPTLNNSKLPGWIKQKRR